MCGRYTLAKSKKTIKKHFYPVTIKCEHRKRYNIAPGQNSPIVTLKNNQRDVKLMRWGLVPSWAKNIKTAKTLINARSETVHQNPLLETLFKLTVAWFQPMDLLNGKSKGGKKYSIIFF